MRKLAAIWPMNELAQRLSEAVQGRSRQDALRELMRAYRAFAVERPHRYQLIHAGWCVRVAAHGFATL